MTLDTTPGYDSERVSRVGERAVVVGASVAGLLAARVLADGFEEVVVVDRDSLPTEPEPRRGVPQGHQIHLLHEAGRATIEDLLPGYCEELVSSGGLLLDYGSDFKFYANGEFLVDAPSYLPVHVASRPLYEQVIRRLVSDFEPVEIRSECHCNGYLTDETDDTVEGVEIRKEGTDEELDAELVVDTTGRTSTTPTWLEAHGYEPPPTDKVHIDLAYTSTYIERPADKRRVFYDVPSPPRTRGTLIHPVEGDRWIVTMIGMHGDHAPDDPDGFEAFAESLPATEPKRLLEEHDRVSEIRTYPFPYHQRHRYEDLDAFPAGLVVIGDAITSFNPVYAQGMSVAALEALQLHRALSEGNGDDLALRFFDRAEEVVSLAWDASVGSDTRYDQTEGPEPSSPWLVDRYMDRLRQTAQTDPTVVESLHRVVRLERHPSSLFHPEIVLRVLTPTR